MTDDADRIATLLVDCFRAGGKVLVCGNGGSAAEADHLVAELVGRYAFDRPPLPAINLAASPAVLTCIANDYGYPAVFARQVRALGKPGDVLVCLTTSGRSENVIMAAQAATDAGCSVAIIRGGSERLMWCLSARALGATTVLLEGDTGSVQEQTLALIHAVCGEVERRMFGEGAA